MTAVLVILHGGSHPPGNALCISENTRATGYSSPPPLAGTVYRQPNRVGQSVERFAGREYGRILPKGINMLRQRLPRLLENTGNSLSNPFRCLLAQSYRQLQKLDRHINHDTREMVRQSQQSDVGRRLQTIPGYGSIVAGVFHRVVGNGEAYRRGRDVSASLGRVPRRHSSGGKRSCRGSVSRRIGICVTF